VQGMTELIIIAVCVGTLSVLAASKVLQYEYIAENQSVVIDKWWETGENEITADEFQTLMK
jgi:hypothetical protein